MEKADRDMVQDWLNLQCRMLSGVTRAVVLLKGGTSSEYQSVALWPDNSDIRDSVIQVGRRAIHEHRRVLESSQFENPQSDSPDSQIIACPVFVDGVLAGAFSVELNNRSDTQQRAAIQVLTWTAAWLEILLRHQGTNAQKRHQNLVEVIAQAVTRDNFSDCAAAITIILANQLHCSRVTLGYLHDKDLRIHAMSHVIMLDEKNSLVRKIASAMYESVEQGTSIQVPEQEGYEHLIHMAHKELSAELAGASVCTIPLMFEQQPVGALTLERIADNPLDQDAISELETLAAIIGPVLAGKDRIQKSIFARCRRGYMHFMGKLFGPEQLIYKIALLIIAVVLALSLMIRVDYRVVANANLEGTIQRVVVSPFDGFLIDAFVKAGDVVENGQVMGRLDDKDLRLEYIKWSSQKAQLIKSQREAVAKHERTESNILKTQLDQADAELALVEEKLSRTQLLAPISGLVVSGDLSQSLGIPLERGQILFEIAPLNAYRIMLNVDEREVGYIQEGQNGQLVLSSLPLERFEFVVERVLPVSVAADGRNYFQVEAKLDKSSNKLRPGMSGIGKINAGEYPLLWTWTHSIIDWLRLFIWKWS